MINYVGSVMSEIVWNTVSICMRSGFSNDFEVVSLSMWD